MRFTKFKIVNFKGIKELVFKLEKERTIYTLVGLNESGKTSVLEAINTFMNEIPTAYRHKYIPKNKKFNYNDRITISGHLELSSDDIQSIKDFITQSDSFIDIKIGSNIVITHSYRFENSNPSGFDNTWDFEFEVKKDDDSPYVDVWSHYVDLWQKAVKHIEVELLPKIVYYPNFLFDFPEKIYLETQTGETIEYEKYRDVLQDILFAIAPNLTLADNVLPLLKKSTAQNDEVLDLLLVKMSEYVTTVVFSVWDKLFKRGNKEIVIKHGKEVNPANELKYYFQFKLKEGAEQFFISERSLGFKWFFSFLLFTGLRKNRLSDKGDVLFLLDEPASNLHPSAQINLLKTFEEMRNKFSIIYSTHSHYMINPNWLNSMYIVKNKAVNYKNEIDFVPLTTDIEIFSYKFFVSHYPNQREYFQPILDTLDHKPGLLEKVPSIVIVEGKNDFYTFNYVNKIYFDELYKFYFYPGGGANADEQVIKLYIAWNRNFLILRDSDAAGKKAINVYNKQFVEHTRNRLFTLSDVSQTLDNIALEQLFTYDEQIRIIEFASSETDKFDKSRFNLSIQLLLASATRVELSVETIGKFKMVFEFLQEKLYSHSKNEMVL